MSELEIEKKVKKIDNTMAIEGMPLTDELKQMVRNCLLGVTTPEKEIEKLNKKYKVKHEQ
ncbi:MAG: hypothetical protein FWF46_04410 [Oscillospiraceae bacterium]|nr:hypothetical protein [Oscillospiraceae bacterium]